MKLTQHQKTLRLDMTQMELDLHDFILETTKDNKSYIDENGRTRSHPDNKYPPIDVFQMYYGKYEYNKTCQSCGTEKAPF